MKIEIENPLELLLEITYLNGILNEKTTQEFININKLSEQIIEGLRK